MWAFSHILRKFSRKWCLFSCVVYCIILYRYNISNYLLGIDAVKFLWCGIRTSRPCHIALHRYYFFFFFFYKLKICGSPTLSAFWPHFSNNICSVSVFVTFWWFLHYFKPSSGIKVMTHWRLRWWLVFFSKIFIN